VSTEEYRVRQLHPGAGSVIFFYDMLEDGNGDDRALHASLPKTAGEHERAVSETGRNR
jgi:hypothetical protein